MNNLITLIFSILFKDNKIKEYENDLKQMEKDNKEYQKEYGEIIKIFLSK